MYALKFGPLVSHPDRKELILRLRSGSADSYGR